MEKASLINLKTPLNLTQEQIEILEDEYVQKLIFENIIDLNQALMVTSLQIPICCNLYYHRNIRHYLKENLLNIPQVFEMTNEQFIILRDNTIRNYLCEKRLSIEQIFNLKNWQRDFLIQPFVHEYISQSEYSISEVLNYFHFYIQHYFYGKNDMENDKIDQNIIPIFEKILTWTKIVSPDCLEFLEVA